ncbi:hypothetical protein SAMN05421786_11712 [Chryseobacterium ureilyticum]|uniref:Lipoprotein n=1 Tax=Chryseobacterium ureilyticum TaxID=373668 RepID=A0A1N7QT11_9FLAO|nr:hypothetical protein [Chryseobacterium ureilyticum]SIT26013.1 hypothetical protein SAMN05421786_11712 [Chryseobacterium ureilyticum]
MKNTIITMEIICFALLIFSCKSKDISIDNSFKQYRVYKIDSLNNFYLIYAKKDKELYKIVSKKVSNNSCNKVLKPGSSYDFIIHSINKNAPVIGGIKIAPINSADINCYQFDKETSICKEAGVNDLYFADNIIGKCLTVTDRIQ